MMTLMIYSGIVESIDSWTTDLGIETQFTLRGTFATIKTVRLVCEDFPSLDLVGKNVALQIHSSSNRPPQLVSVYFLGEEHPNTCLSPLSEEEKAALTNAVQRWTHEAKNGEALPHPTPFYLFEPYSTPDK